MKREFGADPELKKLYKTYLTILLVGGFIWWIIPITIYLFAFSFWAGAIFTLVTIMPLSVSVILTLFWVPKFFSSITFVLDNDEIVVKKGVWWKTKSVVPYNRITKINN